MRGRTRVAIDHPDLTDSLKQIAAEAVRTIRQAANEAATGREREAVQADLAIERQARAATQARLEAGRAELEAAGRQLAELRTQFSPELERAREQVTIAQERAEASERRALRELDQERAARWEGLQGAFSKANRIDGLPDVRFRQPIRGSLRLGREGSRSALPGRVPARD